jgi:hypothetical protein
MLSVIMLNVVMLIVVGYRTEPLRCKSFTGVDPARPYQQMLD